MRLCWTQTGRLTSDLLLLYHGTPSVENAKRILCGGFSTPLRSRQQYGPGEYFADTLTTPLVYASATGAIVLAAVLNRPGVVTRTAAATGECFTVVNSPTDGSASYALPLLAVPVAPVTPRMSCSVCSNIFKQYVFFGNIRNQWQPLNARDSAAVVNSQMNQRVAMNGFEYVYDLTAMTQTNVATGTVRSLFITSQHVEHDRGDGVWERMSACYSTYIVNGGQDQLVAVGRDVFRYDIANMTRTNMATGERRRIRFVDGFQR
jgi:hypothetical protein